MTVLEEMLLKQVLDLLEKMVEEDAGLDMLITDIFI